jgi:adenylate kinase
MILLMGIAGSGKGTQGKLLAEARGYKIISTGELLRNYGSDEQHARMHRGEILGDEEVTDMLDRALGELEDQNKVILDGYPRTVAQSKWLLSDDKQDRFTVNYVLHLITSREAAKERIHIRARSDDHDAAIEARFDEYEKATLPIINYYKDHGLEVAEVNGEQSIEDVHSEVLAIVDARTDVHAG